MNVAAPFMGAWIEICAVIHVVLSIIAAPFMGAWIEISYLTFFLQRQ